MLVSMGDMRVVREQEISPLRFAPVEMTGCVVEMTVGY
jgi:hypothetical protein